MLEVYRMLFASNYWVMIHAFGGGLIALMLYYCFKSKLKLPKPARCAFLATLLFAIGWEVYEFVSTDIVAVYGTAIRAYLDMMGDILAGGLVALMAMWVKLREEEKE